MVYGAPEIKSKPSSVNDQITDSVTVKHETSEIEKEDLPKKTTTRKPTSRKKETVEKW